MSCASCGAEPVMSIAECSSSWSAFCDDWIHKKGQCSQFMRSRVAKIKSDTGSVPAPTTGRVDVSLKSFWLTRSTETECAGNADGSDKETGEPPDKECKEVLDMMRATFKDWYASIERSLQIDLWTIDNLYEDGAKQVSRLYGEPDG